MIDLRRNFLTPLYGGLLVLSLLLVGCSSKDNPPPDEAATTGVVIAGDPGTAITLPANPEDIVAVNAVLDLDGTLSYNTATSKMSLHFFLRDTQGNGISLTENNGCSFRIYASRLVSSTAAEDPGLRWEQLLGERANSITSENVSGLFTVVDGSAGEYSYVFADADGVLANAMNSAANTDKFRVTLRTRCRTPERIYIVNPVNASYDFEAGTPGTRLTSGSGADMASTEACNSCHGSAIGRVGHGGGYTEVKTCSNCHNFDYMQSRNGGEGDLAHMIHKIHDGGVFTTLDDGFDASHVTYPQHLYKCDKCHNNDAGDAPNFDLAYSNPTRKNCGACHDDVVFEGTGLTHPGDAQTTDENCTVCHTAAGVTINGTPVPSTDHTHITAFNPLHFEPGDTVNDPKNIPEFDVQISLRNPDDALQPYASDHVFTAGESIYVVVTLKEHASGAAVDPGFYTSPRGAAGVTTDSALRDANLYIYGPRSQAVPVLATGTKTDPAFVLGTTPTQAHRLFTGGTDPQVRSGTGAFTYQTFPIPADMQAGTYMMRFEGGDYGAISATDYQTTSTAVITFQVGTAEEEPKVSGDACINCHGDTRMHLTGAHPHNQSFDTDGCLGCHDLSGNYGEYIGNRVHAIHSASSTGDQKATLGPANRRDWSHVAFPQDPNNCTVCHTNTDAEVPVWRTVLPMACGGCHGLIDDASLGDEAIAASHMILMGADFDNPTPVAGCLVCHGEGQLADLYVKHNLVDYSVPLSSDEEFR